MFNHARTLLLNLENGNSPGFDFPAEELIPATFHSLELPTYITTVRQRLFGAQADRAMLNYRGMQLMTLLHSTPLVEFVLRLDPRITYTKDTNTELLDPAVFQPKVTQLTGTPANLYVTGTAVPPDASGQMEQQFGVDVLGATIKVNSFRAPVRSQISDLSLTSGISAEFDLPGSGYKFRVDTVNPGCSWRISSFIRPQWDLGQLAASLTSLSEPTTLQLFGVTGDEPWLTFRNLWFTHKELPYRLGGLLLALIYRTDKVFRQDGQS